MSEQVTAADVIEERASDCVSKKISHLMHTGKYSQDQAIAIAYSECEGRTLSAEDVQRVTPLYADVIERACAPQDEEDQRSMTRRFVDRAVEMTAVEGVVRGFISIWGNPECVRFEPGVHVSWGSGSDLTYGRVAELLPGDELRIELHRMNPGRTWMPLGSYVTLPKLSVRATDQHGTWFDRTRPPEMGLSNGMHRRPIMLEHAEDAIGAEIVGTITRVWSDAEGIRFEAELDRSLEVFPRTISKVQRGDYKTSSATMEHTAIIREDGSFEKWILGEHTLTESPSERRMPAVTLIRSQAHEEARAELRAGDEQQSSLPVEESVGEKQMLNNRSLSPELAAQLQQWMSANNATADDLAEFVQSLQQQPAEAEAAPEVAMSAAPPAEGRSLIDQLSAFVQAKRAQQQNSDVAALRAEIAEMKRAQQAANNAPPAEQSVTRGARQPVVSNMQDLRYDHLGPQDALFAAKLMTDRGIPMSETFVRAMTHKVVDGATSGKMFRDGEVGAKVARHARRMGVDGLLAEVSNPYARADELMASDSGAGKGQDWVGTYYATTAWDFIRQEPITQQLIQRGMMEEDIPAGAKTVIVPTVGADPTIYAANEANDTVDTGLFTEATATPSYQGTGSVTVSANELRAVVYRTLRLEETSVISVAQELNRSLQLAFAEAYEYVLVNGDTETSGNTNINLIDGTPASAPSKPKYLVSNGFLKSPLVTTTTYSRDNGTAALTDADYLSTVSLLPGTIVSSMTRNGVFLVDYRTYLKTLQLASLKTVDSVGSAATIINGELRGVWGVPVLNSGQMGLANTAGKIASSSPSTTNIYGRILFVVPRYWKAFWGRQLTIETDRDVRNSTTIIAAHMVAGIAKRSTDGAAVSYRVVV